MKSTIIYYSYSGNTKKVAETLAEYLKQKSDVEIIELKALDESSNFFKQCIRAFKHRRAQIAQVNFNLSAYDLICLGSPVWAFGPAPAMNEYLDQCHGVEAKKILLFTTYGSGTGNEKCLNYMQDALSKKGGREFSRFSVQQAKVSNKEFVLAKIKETRL